MATISALRDSVFVVPAVWRMGFMGLVALLAWASRPLLPSTSALPSFLPLADLPLAFVPSQRQNDFASDPLNPSLFLESFTLPILFQDDFNDGNDDGWEVSGAGNWSVVNGEYVVEMGQGIKLRGISVNGDPAWANFVYEVDVRGEVGVDKVIIARYVDEDNWYALNLRSAPFSDVTLSREEAGQHTILTSAFFANEIGEWHHLVWVFDDNRIRASVDGFLAINYEDVSSSLENGRIGLSGWTGAWEVDRVVFDNVIVSDYSGPTDVALTNIGGRATRFWLPFVLVGILFLLARCLLVWYAPKR